MIRRNLYPYPMRNPVLQWFWEHGGEDPDWGHFHQVHELNPYPYKMAMRELIGAIVVKDIANRTKNKELLSSANGTIEALIDDFCGTPPRRKWPFPGPPPQVLDVVSELSLLANTLQQGGLRNEFEDISSKLVTRSFEMGGRPA